MDQTLCARVKSLLASEPEKVDALPPTLSTHVEDCDRCRLELAAAGQLTRLLSGFGDELTPSSTPEQLAARAVLAAEPGNGRQLQSGGGQRWLWAGAGALAAAGLALAIASSGGAVDSAKSSAPVADSNKAATGNTNDRPVGTASNGTATTASPKLAAANTPSSNTSGGLSVVRCSMKAAGQNADCAIKDGRLSTGPAERARLVLSDGTTLSLNYGSQVAVSGDKPRAIQLLVGEAYVDVVRQAGLPPLAVSLPSGRVDVIGTKLTLRAQPKMSVVSVVTGKVRAHGGGSVEGVGAGEQAVMVQDRAPIVSPAPNLAIATDWARERPTGGDVDDGAETTGFGTLNARKPGANKDVEGLPLRLADHSVTVNIQGVVARTEVTEVFANDTGTTLEGVYSFPLPPGAQIAALDLEVDGRWEHGAIVERERGDKIWRGVIRNAAPKKKRRIERREWIWVPGPWKDPALMQWKQGNRFELRIFPIPARGSRKVRIAYTTPMVRVPGGRRYVMPLAGNSDGTPQADRFSAEVRVGGGATADNVRFGGYAVDEVPGNGRSNRVIRRYETTAFKPSGALVVDVAEPPEQASAEVLYAAYRDPNTRQAYAMVNLRPRMTVHTDTEQQLRVVVLVDRSYSTQQARLHRSGVLVEDLIERLGKRAEVKVLACAAQCESVTEGWLRGGSDATAIARKVAALEAIGASDVQAMLVAASDALKGHAESVATRVILIGDGVATSGEVETQRLSDFAKKTLVGARLTTVSLGGEIDEPLLRGLADAGSGAYIAHGPGSSMASTGWEVAVRQIQAPVRGLTVTLPAGAHEVSGVPTVLWPGQELLVTARLDSAKAALEGDGSPAKDAVLNGDVVVSGTLNGQAWERRIPVSLNPTESRGNAFVPRMWAQARIAELQRRDDKASRTAVVALSKRHHVLSRHTSLIVLESAAMARAFKVDDTRPAVDWDGEDEATVALAGQGGLMDAAAGGSKGMANDDSRADFGDFGMGKAASGKFAPAPPRTAATSPREMPKKLANVNKTGGEWRQRGLKNAKRKQGVKRPRMDRRGPRGGGWMRVVHYRTAAIGRAGGASAYDLRKLAGRKAEVQARPESRERTRDLVRWHVRLGDIVEARKLVERWLSKDRMDIDALTELAGIEALEGNFERSEALLASIVDVDRTAAPGHERLHELYVAAGQHTKACAQATARGLLATPEPKAAAAAMRCARVADSERFLGRLSKSSDRKKALKLAAAPAKLGRVQGKITAKAEWAGGGQIDLVVVTPKGRVVTWQGGDKRTTSALSQTLNAEQLGIRAREVGRYRVYAVHRVGGASRTSGSVTVKSYKRSRRESFTLSPGERQALFDVRIQRKSRQEWRQR